MEEGTTFRFCWQMKKIKEFIQHQKVDEKKKHQTIISCIQCNLKTMRTLLEHTFSIQRQRQRKTKRHKMKIYQKN